MIKYQFTNIPHERENVVIDKVKYELGLRTISITGLSRACGRDRATIYRWLRGDSHLLWEDICDILDYMEDSRR